MIQVYLTENKTQLPYAQYQEYLALLPKAMANKIQRYHRWQDAQASLFGKLMLVEGLIKYGYDHKVLSALQYSEYDRPSLQGGPEFNISHAGSIVVCAITEGQKLGIDVEEVKEIDFEDFRSIWRADEWANIYNTSGDTVPFFTYWTRKEAVIKADGKGLSIPLKEIYVYDDHARIHQEKWYLKQLNLYPNYLFHLCSNLPIDGPIDYKQLAY